VTAIALAGVCTWPFVVRADARGGRQEAPQAPAQPPQAPPATPPAGQAPDAGRGAPPTGAQTPGNPAPGSPAAAPGTAPPIVARAFATPTGLIFNAVRPERVADFERALGYFLAALEKSADPGVRAQAQGWRVMKATEPGPNGSVVYVFLIDPTVPNADYSLGPILAEAYANPAELQQIWKLYTSALTSNGTSLMSLTPVKLPPPAGPLTTPIPGASTPATAPSPGATSSPTPPAPTPPAPTPPAPAPPAPEPR
jgi:hypothetical protein